MKALVAYLDCCECCHNGWWSEAVCDEREVRQMSLDCGIQNLLRSSVAERRAVLVQEIHQLLCDCPEKMKKNGRVSSWLYIDKAGSKRAIIKKEEKTFVFPVAPTCVRMHESDNLIFWTRAECTFFSEQPAQFFAPIQSHFSRLWVDLLSYVCQLYYDWISEKKLWTGCCHNYFLFWRS